MPHNSLIVNSPALLECGSGRKLGGDEKLAATWLESTGVPWRASTTKEIQRQRVDVFNAPLVAGGLSFMRAAIQSLGLKPPVDNCYPTVLHPFLGRSIRRGILGHALNEAKYRASVFVKPAERTKRFTGLVLDGTNGWKLTGVPDKEPVWISEPVHFVAEWRVYVMRSKPVFVGFCDGDRLLPPNHAVIDALIMAWDTAPAAFVFDVGVIEDGKTLLVEVNDGYSVGAYDGITADAYGNFLSARWREFTAMSGHVH